MLLSEVVPLTGPEIIGNCLGHGDEQEEEVSGKRWKVAWSSVVRTQFSQHCRHPNALFLIGIEYF